MKKILFLFATCSSMFLYAQNDLNKDWGLGMNLSQHQKDFGLGLNVTTPFFISETMALRIKGNMNWFEHLGDDGEMTWTEYANSSLGLVVKSGMVGESIRLYGEGGLVVIKNSNVFSSSNLDFGGYGLFGFEFFFYDNLNYYLELGGMGTGAKGDKIAGSPIHSNGMIINVGFRAYL